MDQGMAPMNFSDFIDWRCGRVSPNTSQSHSQFRVGTSLSSHRAYCDMQDTNCHLTSDPYSSTFAHCFTRNRGRVARSSLQLWTQGRTSWHERVYPTDRGR